MPPSKRTDDLPYGTTAEDPPGCDAGAEPTAILLRDGRTLLVRPVRPDDAERLEALFYRLSPQARVYRFLRPKEHITPEELQDLSRSNPPERIVFVATAGEGDNERIVAVARAHAVHRASDSDGPDPVSGTRSAQADGPKVAEVAVVVEDAARQRGIGTELLAHLTREAKAHGIERLITHTLPANTAMMEVIERSGLAFERSFDEGLYRYSLDLGQLDEFEAREDARQHQARAAGMRYLLAPRSVAVIGATPDPAKIGGAVFRNMMESGFEGVVFPVNPGRAHVGGVLAYPSVREVPGDVDLAVIVVPAKAVPGVVDECAVKGVRGIVVISAGFGEIGGKGKDRERALLEKVLANGMRLVGPNCLGVLNAAPEVGLNATFAPVRPPAGRVSMGSQSGALGVALLDHARAIGLGISQFVSLGNRVDVSSNDLLEFWEDDPNTDVILLYLESFGNPRKFGRIARRVSRRKPIIAVKGGRSAAGARAASSHTGSLAGASVAAEALLRQAGVLQVDSIEEMFGVAQVLAAQPAPAGDRVAIVTNAGGPGILAADACAHFGLEVAPLSEASQARLRELLPEEASVVNPVDAIASASAQQLRETMAVVLQDPAIDALLVIFIPPPITRPEDVADAVRWAVAEHGGGKPVIACFMMSRGAPAELRLDDGRQIPSFVFPEDAVKALARARLYARIREREEGRIPRFDDIDRAAARERAQRALGEVDDVGAGVGEGTGEGRWLMPEEALALVADYGIPTVPTRVAHSADEAASAAAELGLPVAMKLRSTTIMHKSDIGGVALGLESADAVRSAFKAMEAAVSDAGQAGEMEGVVLQPMAGGGREIIIGMSSDPSFGPLIMTGLGGIHVEALKDVAFSLHPLTDADPARMLSSLRGLPLLTGWRGSPPLDIPALEEVLLRFSALIEDVPELEQIEINPLILHPEGDGGTAVDARAMVRGRR